MERSDILSLLHLILAQSLLFTLSSLMNHHHRSPLFPAVLTLKSHHRHPHIWHPSSPTILFTTVVLPIFVLVVVLPPSTSLSSFSPLPILISHHHLLQQAHLAPLLRRLILFYFNLRVLLTSVLRSHSFNKKSTLKSLIKESIY